MKYLLRIFFVFSLFSGCSAPPGASEKEESSGSDREGVDDGDGEAQASLLNKLDRIESKVKEAIRTGELVTAKQGVRKGLTAVDEDGKGLETRRAKFLLLLGIIEREQGREIEARRHFDDAMAVFHVHKHTEGKFETYLALGELEARRGDYTASQRQYTAAEALKPKVDDRGLIGMYLEHTSRLASRLVDHTRARDGFNEAIKVYEEIQNKRAVAENLVLLAAEEDALQRTAPCRRALQKAQSIFQDLEDMDGEARALHRLAAIAEREKKYKKAKQLYSKVLDLYDKLDRSTAAAKLRQHINALPDPE